MYCSDCVGTKPEVIQNVVVPAKPESKSNPPAPVQAIIDKIVLEQKEKDKEAPLPSGEQAFFGKFITIAWFAHFDGVVSVLTEKRCPIFYISKIPISLLTLAQKVTLDFCVLIGKKVTSNFNHRLLTCLLPKLTGMNPLKIYPTTSNKP